MYKKGPRGDIDVAVRAEAILYTYSINAGTSVTLDLVTHPNSYNEMGIIAERVKFVTAVEKFSATDEHTLHLANEKDVSLDKALGLLSRESPTGTHDPKD